MPTLLQINVVVNSGSTGRIAEELGQTAMANGWVSYIAYGRNDRPSKSKLIKIGSDWDIKFQGLQTRLFDRHGLGSGNATKKLVDQINVIKPDIIHIHNLHGYYLNIEILFKYLATQNITIIWTFHDCWPITGHCSHFDLVGCEKWKTKCYNCPQKKEYPASYGLDRSEKNFQLKKKIFTSLNSLVIVSVSQWLGAIINQSFLKTYPLQVINNGIDIDVFKPTKNTKIQEQFRLKERFIIIGVASTWSPRKGFQDFITLSRLIDTNSVIILIGLNQQQMNNLPANIIGKVRTENTQELADLYSCADVYVNPTWEDNFPTTNLEALACGTPVVTYKTGGSIESISPDTGFIVEKGSIEGLLYAIETIKINGKEKYTYACRERVLNMYNKNDRFNDYLKLYEQSISKSRR
jgi:glycosyltransferase involved in cell wall biosynthesis